MPYVLDYIRFARPSYPVRIKRAPYPLIVKPSYPLDPASSRPLPLDPAGPLRPVNPARPLDPAGSLRPVNPAGSLDPPCSLGPDGSLRPLNTCGPREPLRTGDSWYRRGTVNTWRPLSLRDPRCPLGPACSPCFFGLTTLSGLVRSPRLFGLTGAIRPAGIPGFRGARGSRRKYVLARWPGDRPLGNRGRVEPGDQVTPGGVLVALSALGVIPVRHVTTAM